MSKVNYKEVEAPTQGYIFSSNKTSDSSPSVHFVATTPKSLFFKNKHYIIAFHTLQLNFILETLKHCEAIIYSFS